MNNRRQWNQFCYKNQMNRMPQRNNYQHQHFQNFPPNFNNPWNPSMMAFEPDRFQRDFRSKRGMNRQQFRTINTNGNNNMRRRRNRLGGNAVSSRNSWVLEDDSCYGEPEAINFMPLPQERKPFIRESSLPPVSIRNRIHESRKTEFFDNRSSHVAPMSSVKSYKTIRPENPTSSNSPAPSIKSFKTIRPETPVNDQMAWSDSESDSRDTTWVDSEIDHKSDTEEGHIEKDTLKVVNKDEGKLISMIWSDESDAEDNCAKETSLTPKGRNPFKHTIKTFPPYDGKSIIGDEGVFEIKVFHCTFCNIISLDKEKSKSHMLTKYHYKRYLKALKGYNEESVSENHNEE